MTIKKISADEYKGTFSARDIALVMFVMDHSSRKNPCIDPNCKTCILKMQVIDTFRECWNHILENHTDIVEKFMDEITS